MNKFKIQNNFETLFKDDCDAELKKLCEDEKCSSKISGNRFYLNEDSLMIDLSESLKKSLFV